MKVSKQVIKTQINNFYEAPKTESKTETSSFKLTMSQKNALRKIAAERGIPVSVLVTSSIQFYLAFVDHAEPLLNNKDVVIPILERIR